MASCHLANLSSSEEVEAVSAACFWAYKTIREDNKFGLPRVALHKCYQYFLAQK